MRVIAAAVALVLAIVIAVTVLSEGTGASLPKGANTGSAGTSATGSAGSTSASDQDATFLQNTEQMNLLEQSIGPVARQRTTRPSIVDLADQTTTDHHAVESAVSSLAQNLGVTLPTSPSTMQQAQAGLLKSIGASSVDETYARMQVVAHKESIADTEQEINTGDNDDVVAYAKAYLPIAQMHLRMAQEELDALEGNSTTGGGATASPSAGFPTAVPAGTGGLVGRHESSSGWTIALLIGVLMMLAGGISWARVRRRHVRA
jgi:putative membrane protein